MSVALVSTLQHCARLGQPADVAKAARQAVHCNFAAFLGGPTLQADPKMPSLPQCALAADSADVSAARRGTHRAIAYDESPLLTETSEFPSRAIPVATSVAFTVSPNDTAIAPSECLEASSPVPSLGALRATIVEDLAGCSGSIAPANDAPVGQSEVPPTSNGHQSAPTGPWVPRVLGATMSPASVRGPTIASNHQTSRLHVYVSQTAEQVRLVIIGLRLDSDDWARLTDELYLLLGQQKRGDRQLKILARGNDV